MAFGCFRGLGRAGLAGRLLAVFWLLEGGFVLNVQLRTHMVQSSAVYVRKACAFNTVPFTYVKRVLPTYVRNLVCVLVNIVMIKRSP